MLQQATLFCNRKAIISTHDPNHNENEHTWFIIIINQLC